VSGFIDGTKKFGQALGEEGEKLGERRTVAYLDGDWKWNDIENVS